MEKIAASDDKNENQVYDILNKEIDSAFGRKEFIEYVINDTHKIIEKYKSSIQL